MGQLDEALDRGYSIWDQPQPFWDAKQYTIWHQGLISCMETFRDWAGRKLGLKGLPTARRLPIGWRDAEEDGGMNTVATQTQSVTTEETGPRIRDSTQDEIFYLQQLQEGYRPAEMYRVEGKRKLRQPSNLVHEEEQEFGHVKLGFPTERRPNEYCRELLVEISENFVNGCGSFPIDWPACKKR